MLNTASPSESCFFRIVAREDFEVRPLASWDARVLVSTRFARDVSYHSEPNSFFPSSFFGRRRKKFKKIKIHLLRCRFTLDSPFAKVSSRVSLSEPALKWLVLCWRCGLVVAGEGTTLIIRTNFRQAGKEKETQYLNLHDGSPQTLFLISATSPFGDDKAQLSVCESVCIARLHARSNTRPKSKAESLTQFGRPLRHSFHSHVVLYMHCFLSPPIYSSQGSSSSFCYRNFSPVA